MLRGVSPKHKKPLFVHSITIIYNDIIVLLRTKGIRSIIVLGVFLFVCFYIFCCCFQKVQDVGYISITGSMQLALYDVL